MNLHHRLHRLERIAPKPKAACPYCGFASLKDGSGAVSPGWILPFDMDHPEAGQLLGCKSCCSWVKITEPYVEREDGRLVLTGATPSTWPDYI